MDLSKLSEHKERLELLPCALDRKAREQPTKTWCSVPVDSNDLSKGTKDITWGAASNAYNRTAWSLNKVLGKATTGQFPTVAYLGPSDLRYFFLTVALIKLGYKVLLLQSSLSTDGKLNLLEKTDCEIILYGDDKKIVQDVLDSRYMRSFAAPSVDELMDKSEDVEPYPYSRSLEDGLNDPILVLHTSGSTGLPKPVVLNQGFHAANALSLEVPDLDGRPCIWKMAKKAGRFYIGFPIAHAGGVHVVLNMSAYNDVVVVLTEAGNLSGATFEAMIDYADIKATLIMPRALIEISRNEKALSKLRRLEMLSWSGGPLPFDVGEAISRNAPLVTSWGSTESGAFNLHIPDSEDWEYNYINPSYNTFRWRDVGDGLFEAITYQNSDPFLRHHQKIFWIYPEKKEFAFGDLFSKHPTKPNLFRYEGRIDDMIVLDSGHNFHPTSYQNILLKDPRINAAVILGNGRPELSVILEIDSKSRKSIVDKVEEIWLTVEEVNKRSNKLAQIPTANVIIAKPDKPLPKASKGTVNRKEAEQLYRGEIEAIYNHTNGAS